MAPKVIWNAEFLVETASGAAKHSVVVYSPTQGDKDWSCTVVMAGLRLGPRPVYGATRQQAIELTKQLVKTVYEGHTKRSLDGGAFSWPD